MRFLPPDERPTVGDQLGRALLVGYAVGAALALLELATLRVGWATRGDRIAVVLGVSSLLIAAGALGALALGAVDEALRRWAARRGWRDRGLRVLGATLVTAPWWATAGSLLGSARTVSRVVGEAGAWLGLAATLLVVLGATALAVGSLTRGGTPRRRALVAAVAALLAVACFLVDARVLRRLYPAFHSALLGLSFAGLLVAVAAPLAGRPLRLGRPRLLVALLGTALLAVVAALGLRRSESSWFIAAQQTTAARQVLAPLVSIGELVGAHRREGEPPKRLPRRRRSIAQAGHPTGEPLPSSPQAHLVLVTIDALRPDHLGAYGHKATVGGQPLSPTLDALAERAVRFERAYAQAPHSAYSISSLLTSEYVHSTVQIGLPLPETLADLLGARGWRTEAWFPLGLFFDGRRELSRFAERRFGFARATTWDLDARQLTDDVLRRLDEIRREGEPRSFLWVHYFDVHEPYVRHPEFDLGPSTVERYDSEIAFTDRQLARLVAALGQLDRPVVLAVTADHGEEFKEHGGWYHGSSLYEEQVRVPLLLLAPGLKPQVIRGPVELVDLAPTLMELLGQEAPATQRGDDLAPVLVGEAEPTRPVFSEIETRRMVVQGRHKLINDVRRNTWELYDLDADPRELVNLFDRQPAEAAHLAEELRAWIAGLAAGRPDAAPLPFQRARLGDQQAAPELAAYLLDATQPAARRAEAARLIGLLEGYAGRAALRATYGDPTLEVRAEAALAGGELTDRRALPTLVELLEIPAYRRRAAVMVGRLRDERAVPGLIEAIDDPDLELRRKAIHYLGFVGDARAIAPLMAIADGLRTRPLALLALARVGARVPDPRVAPFLVDHVDRETYEDHRAYEVCALGLLGDPRGIDAARRAALARPPVKWASETLVRLGAIERGAIAGIDLSPDARDLPGLDGCTRHPEPPGGESTDDYAGRTTCALVAPVARFELAVAEPRAARLLLRLAPREAAAGATLSLTVNGQPLPPVKLNPGWQEIAAEVPARSLRAGRNLVELRLPPAPAPLADLDHLLLVFP